MVTRLRQFVRVQWNALHEEFPLHPVTPERTREHVEVMGLYLVVLLVLVFSRYFSELLPHTSVLGPAWGVGDEGLYWKKWWWLGSVIVAYLVPPLLYCRLVMGLSPADVGLRLRGFVEHLPLYVATYLAVLPFVVWVSTWPAFVNKYPLNGAAHLSLAHLVGWEVGYAVQFLALELFFRGVMLLGAARAVGAWAIPIMIVPYCMLHFRKPLAEALGSIVAGLVLGTLAMRTRSVLGGVLVHVAVAWTMDALALWRKGQLPAPW